MIKISLEDINLKSPYEITLNNGDFDFTTDNGTRYSVSFLEDVPLGGCDTYQFGFRKREDSHTGYDSKVRDTLITIIEQFFAENDNVLLYICDTSDGREEKRNRLFIRWFEEFATPERYTLKTANAIVEGQGFYAAIIVENCNPMLESIISDFIQTEESLTGDKP